MQSDGLDHWATRPPRAHVAHDLWVLGREVFGLTTAPLRLPSLRRFRAPELAIHLGTLRAKRSGRNKWGVSAGYYLVSAEALEERFESLPDAR